MKSWVTIDQLQKQIDDFTLGPLDLQIEPGTITALIGNNGSGKSTLLKLIMHLAKPDTGSIKLFGEAVNSHNKNWKPHVAYMPQTMMGVNQFTGESLKILTADWYPHWDENLFQNMIQQWEVPLYKKYGKLSQGLQQKLNLALTISSQASLMILDEPTSFLDIPSTKMLSDILTDWMDSGERAILMTSHQVEDIRKLADYLAILHNGKLLGQFEKGELMARFRRYWLKSDLPGQLLPGEVYRVTRQVITHNPEEMESSLNQNNIDWYDHESLDLEEIITILINDNTQNERVSS